MGASMSEQTGDSQREKRRVTVTQLLRSPVLDATGDQVGRVEDFIAKLTDGGYPPITGLKVGVGGHDVFVGRKVIEKLEPGAVRLNTNTIDMTAFQRLRRLHPAQIADLVEGASHEEGEEIMDAVERDIELVADVFEELDDEHRSEFVRERSNDEVARVLDRMAPDDAADLLGQLDQERRLPVLNLMTAAQQRKLRKLLQYHPTTAGGMMSPDYVWVIRTATVAEALEAIRTDDKSPHQLLNTVFVTEENGRFVGTASAANLLRSDAQSRVDEVKLVTLSVPTGTDLADVAPDVAWEAADPRGDHRARHHRAGRRQRRGRRRHVRAGRTELRLLAAVDAAPAGAGPDRQSGDGRAARRRHRRRPCQAHHRALRPLLGLVLGGGPVPSELHGHQHGVHRRDSRRRVLRIQPLPGRAAGDDRPDRHHHQRQLPALGALDVRVPVRVAARAAARGAEP